MPVGPRQKALRALGSLARRLSKKYQLRASVSANSDVKEIVRVYKQLRVCTHPDKGGDKSDVQALQNAYDEWERTVKRPQDKEEQSTPAPGDASSGPHLASSSDLPVALHSAGHDVTTNTTAVAVPMVEPQFRPTTTFRIHNVAVLLTYSLGKASSSIWHRFVAKVEACRQQWKVKHWSATLEESESGARHVHLMLQFFQRIDVPSSTFAFEGVKPNARPAWTDYLGAPFARRNMQEALDRGFFYVWADKVGTVRMPDGSICVARGLRASLDTLTQEVQGSSQVASNAVGGAQALA